MLNRVRETKPIRGFLFASTEDTENECFERMLFGTDKVYGPIVIRIRVGDLLFLNNLDADVLSGVFKAVSDGKFNIVPEAWNGRYPYQVKTEFIGEKISLDKAEKILNGFRIKRNTPIFGKKLLDLLDHFDTKMTLMNAESKYLVETSRLINIEKKNIEKNINKIDVEEEIPLIESTTLWDFPRQSYGLTPKGDNDYPGVTPALIIYNLLWRYTEIGDLVVDPMGGSGTTLDVCREEGRRCICYDIAPTRSDVIQNDARKIPLGDSSVDMIFIDSPYGDNIRYNEHPDDICKISSETDEFYDELEKVIVESHRILKEGKIIGWLIGDQWVNKKFTPVGWRIYERMAKYFEPVDVISVVRRGQSSNTGVWHNRARRLNFFLRGFKFLIIMRKTTKKDASKAERAKKKWSSYKKSRALTRARESSFT